MGDRYLEFLGISRRRGLSCSKVAISGENDRVDSDEFRAIGSWISQNLLAKAYFWKQACIGGIGPVGSYDKDWRYITLAILCSNTPEDIWKARLLSLLSAFQEEIDKPVMWIKTAPEVNVKGRELFGFFKASHELTAQVWGVDRKTS